MLPCSITCSFIGIKLCSHGALALMPALMLLNRPEPMWILILVWMMQTKPMYSFQASTRESTLTLGLNRPLKIWLPLTFDYIIFCHLGLISAVCLARSCHATCLFSRFGKTSQESISYWGRCSLMWRICLFRRMQTSRQSNFAAGRRSWSIPAKNTAILSWTEFNTKILTFRQM